MVKAGNQESVQQQPEFAAVLQAQNGARVVVPGGEFLQTAEFVRSGPDLVLVGEDGTRILIKDYFAQPNPPALVSDNGAVIDPDLAAILAGPLAPNQYAQAAANIATDGSAATSSIGKVSVLHGKVMVRHADGTRSELKAGDEVFADDVIETGKDGSVGLTFADGTTFSLGSAGRMVLDDLVYDPLTHTGEGTIAVLQGQFTFVSGQIPKTAPDALTVKTPSMTVGIRGTAGAGNTQTVVLLAEQGGVAGELVITTPSGQTLTVNVPGLAATVSPTGTLLSVQMSPAQVQALAGSSLTALPNPGSLSNEYNTGDQNQNQDNPIQPPPGQTQQELQQAVQTAVEQALAQQQAAQAAAQAVQQINQLIGQIGLAIEGARRDATKQAEDILDAEEAARQGRIADAIAAVRAVRDQISPFATDAQTALTTAEAAFADTDSDAVQTAVDDQLAIALAKWEAINVTDSDLDEAGIQTLMDLALAATKGTEGGQTVTYAEAVAVYNAEVLPLKSAAYAAYTRLQALSEFNTLAKKWTDGSAITAKLTTHDTAETTAEAVTALQTAANEATAAETAARQAARSPIIERAAAQAEWDVRIDGLAETRAGLGKAIIDYVTLHQDLSDAAATYGLTANILTAYTTYKGLVDGMSADASTIDFHKETAVVNALEALKTAITTDNLDDNDYAQAISSWMTAEVNAVTAETQAEDAYNTADAVADAAEALVTTATAAASDAASAYATGQTAASDAADAAATARYEEVLAATSAQYQAELVMSNALDDLAGDLGSDGATSLSTAKGDVYVAQAAAAAAKAAAASATSYNVTTALDALNDAKAAVADLVTRASEAETAVGQAGTALTMASKRPDSALLDQAEQESQDVANQALIKAEADYAKALTIQAEIANQKALAEAYQAEAQQAYDAAKGYAAADAAATAETLAAAQSAADAAALQAKAAWDTAQAAKTAGDTAAKAFNNVLDTGETRDLAKELDARVRADTDGAGPITAGTAVSTLSTLTTALASASTTLGTYQANAAALGNATVSAKLAAAVAALSAANATSGALKTADTALVNARTQLTEATAGTKQADIQTALTNAQAKAELAAAKSEAAHAVDPNSPTAADDAKALAQEAATAAKEAAAFAATATDLAKQLAATAQTLAIVQTSVDSAVADASAKVKAAVDLVNWANADYLAVSLTTTARNAVDSTGNSADAADTKTFITGIKSTVTASTGVYTQLTAMKDAALATTADAQAKATIQAAFDRAAAAMATINTAISKIDGDNGLLAKAQAALSTAETKTAEALAATSANYAITAATQAQNAAAEAKRLADLIADYRLQVSNTATAATDSAIEIIQAAYDEAVTAQARLSVAVSMEALLQPASVSLSQAQTAAQLVTEKTLLAQSLAKTATDALSDPAKTHLDIADERDDSAGAAGDAATANTTVATKVADAIAKAEAAMTFYEGLSASQKTSVLTAYYEQAKKIIADVGALKTDAADRAAQAAQAATVAQNAYDTLVQYAADADAREVAAIDASSATAKSAIDALTNAAAQAAKTKATADTLDASVNTDALVTSIANFLTAHPSGTAHDAVVAIQSKLQTAADAADAAAAKLGTLSTSISTESGTATSAYNALKVLDADSDPDAADVTSAAGYATAVQQSATKVSGLTTAMDAQKNALAKAIEQISSLQTQFQSYVDSLSGETKAAMKVDAVSDTLTFPEDDGTQTLTQTLNLLGNDTQGSGGTLKVVVLSLPTKGTLYLSDGTTKVTAGMELTDAQAAALKYTPSGAVSSPTATITDAFNYQLVRSGTVEALVNGELVSQNYSTSDSASVTLSITHVNYAPTLQGTAPSLPTLTENPATNTGVSVFTLLAGNANDAETAKASLGMAVTGLTDASIGTWEYKLSEGGTWTTISSVSPGSALLLGPGAYVRFVPAANANSQAAGVTPTITYRAWDTSSGTAGNTADTTTSGGFSAYSSASLSAGITVTAVVLKPTLSLTATELYAPLVTDESSIISLDIGIADIPDSTVITITGLPTGASLSAGTAVDGVWTLTPAQLSGLQLITAVNYNGDITLGITATATDGSGTTLISKTDTATLKIGVGPQNVAVDGVSDKSSSLRPVIMEGGANADTMTGSSLGDSLIGNGGNDTLTGGGGADTLTGGTGSADVFRYASATDSINGKTDTITDFESGSDTIRLEGIGGVSYLHGAYPFTTNTAVTLAAIQADSRFSDVVVFFTDGPDGYLYVKGAGTGTSYDGTFIKLAGQSSPPDLADLSGITHNLIVGTTGDETVSASDGLDVLVGDSGSDTFRFNSANDSTTSATDVISDFTDGDDIVKLQDSNGYGMLRGAYTWAGSTSATIAAIAADTAIANSVVFFTDGTDGWIYTKGAGTGLTSFDGLMVKLAGVTSQPDSVVQGALDYASLSTSALATTEDASASGTAAVRFEGGTFTYDLGLDGGTPILKLATSMGEVSIDPVTGVYTYTPTAGAQALEQGESGSDSFVVYGRNGDGVVGSSTVAVALTGVNDAPVVESDLYFNGNSILTLPVTADTNFAGTEDFTIAMTVQPDGAGTLFRQAAYANELGILTRVNADGSLEVAFDAMSAGGWEWFHTAADTATMGALNDIAITKSGSTITLYVNGLTVTLLDTSGNPVTDLTGARLTVGASSAGTMFGSAQGSDYFTGHLTEISLFNAALDASAISEWTTNGVTTLDSGSLAALQANYLFSIHNGSIVADTTGQSPSIDLGGMSQAPQWAVSATAAEDTVLNGNLVALDPEDNTLTFAVTTAPAHGTLTIDSSGQWTYTPAANYAGTDSAVLRVSDGKGGVINTLLTLTVADVADAPVVSGSGSAVAYNSGSGSILALAAGIDVSDVDSSGFRALTITLRDAEAGDTLSFVKIAGASFGYDGDLYYDDGTSWDTHGASLTLAGDSITVTFAEGHEPPAEVIRDLLRSIKFESVSTNGSTRQIEVVVTDDTDVSTTVTRDITVNGAPTLTLSGDINMGARFDSDSYAAGTIVTPQTDDITLETRFNWSGDNYDQDQVLFYNGDSASAGWGLGIIDGTLHILFAGGQVHDTGVSVLEGEWHDAALVRQAGDWHLFYDGESIDLTLAISPATISSGETVVGNDNTHAVGFNGIIDYTALWTEGRSAAQVSSDMAGTITPPTAALAGYWIGVVSSVGGPLRLVDSSGNNHTLSSGLDSALFQAVVAGIETTEDSAASLVLHIGDDSDTAAAVTRTIQEAAAHGTVTFTGDTYTYTPDSNYSGTDSFVIRLTDSQGAHADYVVDVLVHDQNDAPTSTAFTAQTLTALTKVCIDVASHFSDIDALDTLDISFSTLPDWLSWDADTGILSGIPPLGATAGDITITATDRAGATTSQTLSLSLPSVQIAGVNSAGSALKFSGDSDYAHTSLAMAATGGTVELWAQTSQWDPASEVFLFGNGIAKGDDNAISLTIGPSGLTVQYGGTTQSGVTSQTSDTSTWQDGSWHHLAFTWEQSGSGTLLTLYVDGVGTMSAYTEFAIDAAYLSDWQVGASASGTGAPASFDGAIDNLRMWDDVRSQEEISANMVLETPTDTDGLLANWLMDKVTGGAIVSDGGSEQLVLGATTATEGTDPIVVNQPSRALELHGGYLTIDNPTVSAAMTFEAWVRPDTIASAAENFTAIYSVGTYNSAGFFAVGYDNSGALTVLWHDGTSQHSVTQDSGTLSVGDWNHVAVTITPDGSGTATVQLYINGQSVGSATNKPLVIEGLQASAYVGHADGVTPNMDGAIADLRLYDVALTATDIAQDINTRPGDDEFGLVLGLELATGYEDSSALVRTDIDSNGDDGTFTGVVINGANNFLSTKPTSFSDSLTTLEDTSVTSTLLAVSSSSESLNYYTPSDGMPSHGWVRFNGDGTFTYTPEDDFVGTDQFTIRVDDGLGNVADKDITVTVNAVDDPISAHPPTTSSVDAVGLHGQTAIAIENGLATGTNSVTYEGWLWLNSNAAAQQTILAVGDSGTSAQLSVVNGQLNFFLNGSEIAVGGAITADLWNHVAVVVEAGSPSLVTLYVNGIQTGQGSFPSAIDITGTTAYLGRSTSSAAGTEEYLSGSLSDFRVYTEARGVADIRADMTGSTANSTNLYARWTLDTSTGGTIADSVGGHDGSIVGYNYGDDERILAIVNSGASVAIGGLVLYEPDQTPEETPNIPAEIKVTFSAEHGTINFASLSGLTSATGNGTDTVTLTGSLAALNAVLGNVTYTASEGYSGRDGVKIVIDEMASGVTRMDGGTLSILVMAVPTASNDSLFGGSGADTIDGLAGNDAIFGMAGNDVLSGSAGADRLWGDNGNDTLTGGAGADTLTGGMGNDLFRFTGKTDSTETETDSIVDFGQTYGNDVIRLEGMSGIAYNSETTLATLGLGTPSTLADCLSALKSSGPANTMVFFTVGTDGYLYVKGAGTGVDFDGTLIRLENRTTPLATSEIQFGVLTGTPAVDTMTGTAASEVFLGLADNDTIDGAAGDDTLIGGEGADTLTGGTGADRFVYAAQVDSSSTNMDTITDFSVVQGDRIAITGMDGIVYDGVPYAPLAASAGETIDAILADVSIDNRMVFFTQGGDGYLVVSGNGGGMSVDGFAIKLAGVTTAPNRSAIENALSLAGTATDDILVGTVGDDIIGGAAGNDTLSGGAGNDTLMGGSGADTLTGGADGDQFRINSYMDSSSGMPDVVTDFVSGQDSLVFNGISGIAYDPSPYGAVQDDLATTITTIQDDPGITNRAVFFVQSGNGYIYVKSSMGGGFGGTLVKLEGVTTAPTLDDLPGLVDTVGVTLSGTLSGTWSVTGTGYNDTLDASTASNRPVYGLGGDDTLIGAESSTLVGGAGMDYLSGGTNSDFLYTSKDDSNLTGGTDIVNSFTADKSIQFQGIAGIAYTESALDITGASSVADAVTAIAADSQIQDQLVFFTLGGDGYLTVKGSGFGTDYDGTVIKLASVTTAPALASLPGILKLYQGSALVDVPTDSGTGDMMYGLGGDDTLNGGADADVLEGGAGADTLTGGSQGDVFRYTSGTDSTVASMDTITDFIPSQDTIRFEGMKGITYSPFPFAGSAPSSVTEFIAQIQARPQLTNTVVYFSFGGDGYLYVNGSGSGTDFNGTLIRLEAVQTWPALGDIQTGALIGTDDDDVLIGTDGGDIFISQLGNNILRGGTGDDLFQVGHGTDTISGGGGTDTVEIGGGSPVSGIARLGDNLVFTTDGTHSVILRNQFAGDAISSVTLTRSNSSDDTTYTYVAGTVGTSGHDIIAGDGTLSGGNGNDIVLGNTGADVLYGDGGMDVLNGGAGNDVLVGGLEGDSLTGGTGADVFRFLSGADSAIGEWDVVKDFDLTNDKLDLVGLGSVVGLQLVSHDIGDTYPPPGGVAAAIASEPSITNNSIVVWLQNGSTYIYVKAEGTSQNGLMIQLEGFTGTLTEDNFLQLIAPDSPAGSAAWDAGGGNLLWSNAANWSDDIVPDATTAVSLSNTIVTHGDGTTQSVHTLYGDNSTLQLSPGTLNVTTRAELYNGSVLSIGTTGVLGGAGSVMLEGEMNWSGGTIAAGQGVMVNGWTYIENGAHTLDTLLALAGDSEVSASTISGHGELANAGYMTVLSSSGFNVALANDGIISLTSSDTAQDVTLSATGGIANTGIIELGGRYDAGDSTTLSLGGNAALMISDGGVLRARDSGSTTHTVVGEVDLLGGSIMAEGNLTIDNENTQTFLDNGFITVADGKVLTIDGGAGGGLIEIASEGLVTTGTLRLAGTQKVFIDSNFSLSQHASLDLAGAVTFTGGQISNEGIMALKGDDDVFYSRLTNQAGATMTVTAGNDQGDGAATLGLYGGLENSGTLNLQTETGSSDSLVLNLGAETIQNFGQMVVSGLGSGTITINGGVSNSSDGAIHLAGDLAIIGAQGLTNDGTITIDQGKTLDVAATPELVNAASGTIAGSGTIVGTVSNEGTLSPGGDDAAGTLSVNGDYLGENSSTITLDVLHDGDDADSDPDSDLLEISGSASLAGSLVFGFKDYIPSSGESFVAITAASGLDESSLWGTDSTANTADDLIHINHDLGSAWTATWTATGTSLSVTFTQVNGVEVVDGSWGTDDASTSSSAVKISTMAASVTGSLLAGSLQVTQDLTVSTGNSVEVANKAVVDSTADLILAGGTLGGTGDIIVLGDLIASGGGLLGSGLMTVNGNTQISDTNGTLTVDKTLDLRGASTVTGTNTTVASTDAGSGPSTGRVNNYGAMRIEALAASFQIAMVNTVAASMVLDASNAGAATQDMVVTVGDQYNTFVNHGEFQLTGGAPSYGVTLDTNGGIFDNRGVMDLDSTYSSQVDRIDGALMNQGTLYLGHNLVVAGTLNNSGWLSIHTGHGLALETGSTLNNNGVITGDGSMNIDTSAGASFVNNGVINPGGEGTAGSLYVNGDMILGANSLVRLDIGLDSFTVGGALTRGGTVEINTDGASLNTSSTYTVMSWDSSGSSGWFNQITGLDSDPAGALLLDPTISASDFTVRPRDVTEAATSGDDSIDGGTGADYLLLGNGDDIANVQSGADAVFGQNGNDQLSITGTDFHILDGGAGIDTLAWAGADGTTLDLSSYAGILQNLESIDLGVTGTQTLVLTAESVWRMMGNQSNALTGTESTMVVMGEGDNVTLSGWVTGNTQVALPEDPTASYTVYSSTYNGGTVQVYVDNSNTVSTS
ncbi:LamG-like jellyroll fold domain-containing protein [Magnetospirillum aberrantis]|uniref:Tandem-95 repeat protein n=1 Tax=Magnetospirillum aberrantis SpK TaxID=908842 RepID=A0A7C9QS66_9PROT|nr:LamG-like jellyroll fold domain-containing protein [Magnetospirillum aberrantis]NFV79340.1 tandem-95 repeat protein [Magnetospirillum aberrantis SpK]